MSAGTLLVNGSTAAGSAVTVAGSAVLGGSGTTAGTVGVSASGTLAPGGAGVSIGTLSTGAVTFNAAATYSVDLDGGGPTADRVASSGTVTCAGTLSVASLANAAVGRIHTIISAATVTGTFAGLADGATFTVGGRTLSIAYGPTIIEVPLTELAGPDTGATPAVRITVNTTLGFASGPWLVQAEGSGTTASDAAAPVLLATGWVDGGSAGVGAGDTVTLTFSESVQAVGAAVADIGLPVTADTLSSTLVSDQQGASITMTLAGSPCLTPGGTYSVAALGAGKPSGTYLVSGTHLRDAAGNAAATGTPAAAIDLPPTTTTVALAWATASDPQTWNMGALTVGGAISSVGSGIDLTITNPGDSTVDVAIACSSTVPGGWSAGSAAAGDTYFMKADATGAAASQPGNPASYGPVMSGSGQNIVSGLTSGRSSVMALYFQAPTSLSPGGGGTAQAIVVAVTATLAP